MGCAGAMEGADMGCAATSGTTPTGGLVVKAKPTKLGERQGRKGGWWKGRERSGGSGGSGGREGGRR
eukprot:2603633-Rhodomonas_salina.3